jgi:Rrf2 family protein
MLYSTTCMYAIHAVSRLAVISPTRFVGVQEICAASNLPPHFVSKILRDLVGAGLLTSSKGRNGGFALARKPEEILLVQIVEAVDDPGVARQCLVGLGKCDDRQPCPQHDSFKPVRQQIIAYLTNTTLRDMAEALVRKAEILGQPLGTGNSRASLRQTSDPSAPTGKPRIPSRAAGRRSSAS